MAQQLSTNTFGPAKWIVNATASVGTHTTIASALTSASSGDTIFIMPGTYTENLTLKAGVNLSAYNSDGLNGNVTIVGNCTATFAGTAILNGLRLQTNSASFLTVSGSSATIVRVNNCYLNCTNGTGITFSSSSASAVITIYDCLGDLGGSQAFFACTSAGTLQFINSVFSNSGSATTQATASSGSISVSNSTIPFAIAISSTGTIASTYSQFLTNAINATAITLTGTGNSSSGHDIITTGTASALSVGSGTTYNVDFTELNSSNAASIAGTGTINYNALSMHTTAGTVASTVGAVTTYMGGISFDHGTNTLSNYATGTFTPTLTGASTAGTTTYTNQFGYYTRVGNMVSMYGTITGTAATGTGAATIGALPFTIKNQTQGAPTSAVTEANAAGWVYATGATYLTTLGTINTTTATMYSAGSAVSGGNIAMANATFDFVWSLTHQI